MVEPLVGDPNPQVAKSAMRAVARLRAAAQQALSPRPQNTETRPNAFGANVAASCPKHFLALFTIVRLSTSPAI
jgi:hypothetical protein